MWCQNSADHRKLQWKYKVSCIIAKNDLGLLQVEHSHDYHDKNDYIGPLQTFFGQFHA